MTEQSYFILASLTAEPLHGYAIAREVKDLSKNRVNLSAGTLYGVLERLSQGKLIEVDHEETVNGRRRRYYRLTGAGSVALAAEVEQLRAAVAAVETRIALPAGKSKVVPA